MPTAFHFDRGEKAAPPTRAQSGATSVSMRVNATARIPGASGNVWSPPPSGYPAGLWRIAPDLAIEILSPSNRPADVQEKIVDYLAEKRLI